MTQEEKAKAYDEALEDMRVIYPNLKGDARLAVEHAFPKLAESEDEKTRKELLSFIESVQHNYLCATDRRKKWIAYLEKQKELPFVKDVMLGYPGLYFYDGERMHFQGNPAMEEKQKEQEPEEKPINWTELTWKDIVELEGIINNVHYEFRNGIGQESFGKEVLEKFREYKGDEYLDKIEQKPVDVDLDNASQDYVYNHFCSGADFTPDYIKGLMEDAFVDGANWQKEQKPAEWSEEDEIALRELKQFVVNWEKEAKSGELERQLLWTSEISAIKRYLKFLNSLRPQPKHKDRYQEGFQDGVYEGRRKAWEEYNKSVAFPYGDFNHRLSCYEGGPCTNPFFDCVYCPRMGNGVVKTYTSPNTTEYQSWKPSEEQMEALKEYIEEVKGTHNASMGGYTPYLNLQSLYNDLEKL